MKIRLILGIIIGLAIEHVLTTFLPSRLMDYVSILIATFVASVIADRIFAGVVVAVLLIASSVIGLFTLPDQTRLMIFEKAMPKFIVNNLIVLVFGFLGGWFGKYIYSYIKRHRASAA